MAHGRAEHIARGRRPGKHERIIATDGPRLPPAAARNRPLGSPGARVRQASTLTLAGMKVMARSASAAIVSEGLTPGLADTAEPSITYRPS